MGATQQIFPLGFGAGSVAPGTSPISQAWNDAEYSPSLNRYVIVGNGSQCITSDDAGTTWTARNMPANANWWRITWSPDLGLFLAIVINSTTAATSSDGIIWNSHPTPAADTWSGCAWNGTVFCVSDNNGLAQHTITSPDGINWTDHPGVLPTGSSWDGLVWIAALGKFVLLGAGASKVTSTSSDGITWSTTGAVLPTTGNWNSIAWNGSIMVAALFNAGSNVYATSPDGVNWTGRTTLPSSRNWGKVGFSASLGKFIMLPFGGADSNAAVSSDGISWTTLALPSIHNWYAASKTGAATVIGPNDASTALAVLR